jgi:hypothetical protein
VPGSLTVDSSAGHVALFLVLELLALGATVVACALLPTRLCAALAARLRALDERGVVRVIGASLAIVYALAWLTTPQIDWGEGALGLGYGADGVHYGRMNERFAWEPGIGHHYYRILAPALVHYSGLDTFTGFHLLNALSFVVASALMYATARRLGLSRETSLVALALFAVLKFGVKFWIYYPVLTDGLGTLLMMSIIYATVSRRDVLYVASMSAAVFCRENLLALIVFNLLHSIRSGHLAGRYGRAVVLHGIPLALLALSRIFPLFPLQVPSTGLLTYVRAHAWTFVSSPRAQGVFGLGYLNSLGMVVVLALYRAGHVARFLRVHYEWLYYVAATIVMSIVLGVDVDRYAFWLAPALIVASLDPGPHVDAPAARRWVCLLLVHAVSMELFLPWYPERAFTNGLSAAYAQPDAYAAMTIATAALLASLVAAGYLGRSRPRREGA